MKYLFFFKGQPLLLCCVCCKVIIQDFFTGLHTKNKKNLPFHRRIYRQIYRRPITRRYFTESCKKITWLCHVHRRSYRRNITRRYFTESCKTITGLCHLHRRCYRRPLPTESPTDLRTSRSARMCDTCPSTRIPTDRKVWRDFRTFLVRISINFWRNHRRNLMPPTTINVRR